MRGNGGRCAMRAMLGSALDDTQGFDILRIFERFDILQIFERAWLGVSSIDASDPVSEAERDYIWLECNCELVDAASVSFVGVRKFAGDFETLLFVCPRCNEPHESLRFR